MSRFRISTLVPVETVRHFVTHARQTCTPQIPLLIEVDSRPFPDYTNTSALIAVIYWCVTVINLHLTTKWPWRPHSIFLDTPKVTLINQLIHTQPRSVKLCLIHLFLQAASVLHRLSLFSVKLFPLLHILSLSLISCYSYDTISVHMESYF